MNLLIYIILVLSTLLANSNTQDTLKTTILLSEVEIYGGLNENSNATNIQIINTDKLQRNSNFHFEDLIASIGSLHFSGGTSRVKYFQLRGLGELSQFAGEGAPHFYVSYIIDNIDFSGIGMIGNLFDIEQIEIFKGPQSSTYGPNAMAGIINVTSKNPLNRKTFEFNFSQFSYNGSNISISTSLPINKKILSRFTISKNYTNGYIKNISDINIPAYNTNSKNEFLFRSKILIKPNDLSDITLTGYYIDLDNKYDMWTPDNNGFITYSDYQGFDTQNSKALSLKINYKSNNNKFTYISSYLDNTALYSYDGDWANDEFWSNPPYNWNSNNPYYGYWGPWSFKDSTNRKRFTLSHEFRIKSNLKNNIVITSGLYFNNTKEIDNRNGWLFAGYASNINSIFRIFNHAIYTQISIPINNNLFITTSIRLDNNNIEQNLVYDEGLYNKIIKSKSLLGGSIKCFYKINNNLIFNFILSRGYKTSGINQTQSPFLTEDLRIYKTEYSNNIEVGFSYKKNKTNFKINTFYMHRKNPQLRLSYQVDVGDPTSFDYATFNATRAYHYGLELNINNQITKNISLNQSFSNLSTYVSEFQYRGSSYGNRTLAHSPNNKYSIQLSNNISDNLILDIDLNYISSFYFEEQNNEKSDSYNIANISLKYIYKSLEITIWSKNLNNTKYPIRGYTFVLDPTYSVNSYQSFGEPRTLGITLNFKI